MDSRETLRTHHLCHCQLQFNWRKIRRGPQICYSEHKTGNTLKIPSSRLSREAIRRIPCPVCFDVNMVAQWLPSSCWFRSRVNHFPPRPQTGKKRALEKEKEGVKKKATSSTTNDLIIHKDKRWKDLGKRSSDKRRRRKKKSKSISSQRIPTNN